MSRQKPFLTFVLICSQFRLQSSTVPTHMALFCLFIKFFQKLEQGIYRFQSTQFPKNTSFIHFIQNPFLDLIHTFMKDE